MYSRVDECSVFGFVAPHLLLFKQNWGYDWHNSNQQDDDCDGCDASDANTVWSAHRIQNWLVNIGREAHSQCVFGKVQHGVVLSYERRAKNHLRRFSIATACWELSNHHWARLSINIVNQVGRGRNRVVCWVYLESNAFDWLGVLAQVVRALNTLTRARFRIRASHVWQNTEVTNKICVVAWW